MKPHDMKMEEELGERLHAIRKARKMKQHQLAALAGIRRTHLSQIEKGRTSAKINTLYDIAKGLGISLASLLQDVG